MHPEVLEGKDDVPAWEPIEADAEMSLESVPSDSDTAGGAFGRTLLLEDVEEVEISYFGTPTGGLGADTDAQPGADRKVAGPRGLGAGRTATPGLGDGNEADWYDEWLDQPALPILVRIHLATPDRTWPDLIVALPASRT
jgi:general secretion pathway protein J